MATAPADPPEAQATDTMNELGSLLACAARRLADSSDPASFLDWIAQSGPLLAPGLAARVDPRTGPPGLLFRSLGRAIYEAMPLPDRQWGRARLPRPGRNDPCNCGSGRKYKHCCQPLESIAPPFAEMNLLPYMIEAVPVRRYRELAGSRVDLDMVSATAADWIEAGDAKRAIALLEPWFAGSGALSGRLGTLFDRLYDAYLENGNPRKKLALIDQVIARGDRELRSEGWQRRCAVLADQGHHAQAMAAFGEAQRLTPDNPALAPLELTVLSAGGQTGRVAERARYWAGWLRRRSDPALAPLIERIEHWAEHPESVLSSLAPASASQRLETLAGAAPPIDCHYRLRPEDGSAGPLLPERALADAERRWREVFEQSKPGLVGFGPGNSGCWAAAQRWLALLEQQPLLWQSFDVLDDLVLALEGSGAPRGGPPAIGLLIERAAALLDRVIERNRARRLRLEWAWMENRPALRLYARYALSRIGGDDAVADDEQLAPMERLVYELNPNDNHGFRDLLGSLYTQRDAAERLLALCDRYPDDPTMEFDRAFALHRLGRGAEAERVLGEAARAAPKFLPILIAPAPRRPELRDGWMSVGGDDQAWYYRESRRAAWARFGVLDWASSLGIAGAGTPPQRGR
jgi:tetratricopeptide (TPR) repeat protein